MARAPAARTAAPALAFGLVLGLVLVPAACDGDRASPWLDARTLASAHFRYHVHSDDASVCEDTVAELEAHLQATLAFLGLDWPGGKVIDYYKYRSRDELLREGPCRPIPSEIAEGMGPVEGCTVGLTVHSGQPVHEHELVHAYLADAGAPPRMLLEGVAEMLACRVGAWDRARLAELAALGWAEVASWSRYDDLLYQGAVLFARQVLGRHGVDGLMRLYRTAPPADDAASLALAVTTALGASADALWTEALDRPPPGGSCLSPRGCASPPLGAAAAAAAACGVPRTYRSLALDADGGLALAFRTGMERAIVRSCDGEHPVLGLEHGSTLYPETLLLWLEAGRYTVAWEASGPGATGLLPAAAFADAPDGAWLGGDCAAAERAPYVVPPFAEPHGRLVVSVPARQTPWFAALAWPAATNGVIGEDLGFLRERARLCRSCSDDPASCLTFPSVTPASLTFDGRYILALPADPAVQGYAAVGIATR